MKTADYVINFLADKGVDKIFVVYGAANGSLIDAFTRTDKTEYVCTMHEQAAGFAAEGYAKVSGLPGVAIATSGPGGQNFVTPIANCYFDSVPCIFITGQVPTYVLNIGKVRQVGFQETDIVSVVKPITKYARLVPGSMDINWMLEKAWHKATTGRPGPVLLDIPLDIQKSEMDPKPLITAAFDDHCYDIETAYDHIDEYLHDLKHSERPVMLIGGGCRDAIEEFREVAMKLKIPCFPTWNALDIVTSDFEYYGGRVGTYGGAGRNFGIQNSDLILIVGCRLSGRVTGGSEEQIKSFAPNAKKYLVDIDNALLNQKSQRVETDVNICCDAKVFLSALSDHIIGFVKTHDEWATRVMEWKNKYDPVKGEYYAPQLYEYGIKIISGKEYIHPYVFMRTLSLLMSKDDVLVGDCGGNIVALSHAFETKYGQRVLTNNGNSPMGFSFAAAIGCWFAPHKGNIVCTIGDGGFNMNIQELQTLVNYGIKTKTFILNNHVYGITKQFQETNFEGRHEACGPKGYKPPDFRKIVSAYGVKGIHIDPGDDLIGEITEVLEYDGPVVCDIDMHDFHAYEPRISNWDDPIHDMYPKLSREEFDGNMVR